MLQQVGDMAMQAVGKALNNDELVMQELANQTHVVIDQEPDWMEICPICEVENKYKIYGTGDTMEYPYGAKPLAEFREKSDCCCRCFLKNMRKFNGQILVNGIAACNMEAPYTCHNPIPVCSCFCGKSNPQIQVTNANNEYIGRVTMPCYCPLNGYGNCDTMNLRVLDKSDNLIYMIQATCCQKSIWCMPFQCLGCPDIEYTIKDTTKQVVGKIKNIYNDCIRETCSRADKFGVAFPDNAEPHKKLLLINAAIWLDYLQYLA